jgi:predicted ATPase/DNA-binding CsgD family transcriptional regulator
MAGIRSGSTESPSEPLTSREQEILACLIEGLSNQEIANRLFLADKTVRWYNTHIYSKLGVGSRQEAIERAKALRLLNVPPGALLAATGKHNLAAQATPFVGRQHELGEVAGLLNDPDTRLITILAAGGMGKTRLALEAAGMQIGRYPDGVYFVPLAPLRSAGDIVTTTAENLGFSFYGENPPAQQLIDFLSERSLLLVLDNFEHLLDGVTLVADLVEAAPRLRVLITSRERLNLRGETVYTLRGLDFPASETPEEALEYDAVKLFLQSAQRVRPDYALEADGLDFLARICRLTAGMPLGIELAAGWVDVLSLEQIAAEIQQGIDILETEMRDVPERQRSVRATFERTWERLTDEEQRMFMRLSTFRGGFTNEAAWAIAEADVRLLRKLANKALVQIGSHGRHDIHELLRQFGAGKLAETTELPAIQAKHAAFFADSMAERKQDIRTNRQLEALALIDPDFENVRSAWLYTVDRQDWDPLPKFLHSLWFYCQVRTRAHEAVALLEHAVKVLQAAPASDVTELALGRVLARLGYFYGDVGLLERAVAMSEEAIRILRQQNSPEDLIAALYERQNAAHNLLQLDLAASLAQEGLGMARSVGDKIWESFFLIVAGWTSNSQGDVAAALQFAEGALAMCEQVGNRWGLHLAYILLAWIKESQKDFEPAKHLFQQALTISEGFDHVFDIAMVNIGQAKIALHERNYTTARLKLRKALQGWWDAGYRRYLFYSLVYIAQMYADQNEADRAVEILACIPRDPLLLMDADRVAVTLRGQLETVLEPARFDAAWAHGEGRELSAVVAELLAELVDS